MDRPKSRLSPALIAGMILLPILCLLGSGPTVYLWHIGILPAEIEDVALRPMLRASKTTKTESALRLYWDWWADRAADYLSTQ
jgi:hypothetical protein